MFTSPLVKCSHSTSYIHWIYQGPGPKGNSSSSPTRTLPLIAFCIYASFSGGWTCSLRALPCLEECSQLVRNRYHCAGRNAYNRHDDARDYGHYCPHTLVHPCRTLVCLCGFCIEFTHQKSPNRLVDTTARSVVNPPKKRV